MSFWNEYIEDLKRLQKGGGKIFSIGESVLGRPIFCVQIGKGAKKLLVQYAIHAREHITCHLAIRQAENILKENVDGTIFILPLINPDGVCLATDGIKSLSEVGADLSLLNGHFAFTNKVPLLSQTEISRLKKWLQTQNNFPLWKANIRGVDLNVNFDARWATGKQNVFRRGSENFVGAAPESEPETKALVNFTNAIKPHMTISYHCKGEVIYYKFFQTGKFLKRDKQIAKEISKITGYHLASGKGSAGGYKDWCIEKLKIPSLTIEVGADTLSHPIGKEHLYIIAKQNQSVLQKSLALLNSFKL